MALKPSSKLIRIYLVLIVGLIAAGVRFYFAERHVIDEDEPTYLKSSLSYANFLRAGNYEQVALYEVNKQHPPLSKILNGLILLTQPPLEKMHNKYFNTGIPIQNAEGKPWGMAARYTSVVLGTIASMLIAAFDPLAGFFFATQSLVAISTSVVGLEALPLLTSFLSGVFYLRWSKQSTQNEKPPKTTPAWLAFSAIALGMTAASKYTYSIVGMSVLLHYAITCFREPKLQRLFPQILAWAVISLLAFFVFDPYLWPDPLSRLRNSVLFHVGYTQSTTVSAAGFPFWQPLVWLSTPFYSLYPIYQGKIIFSLDRLISIFALAGLAGLWRKEDYQDNPTRLEGSNFYFIWLVIGLVVLLAWPTKWPQYVLIIMVPLCFSASRGAQTAYRWSKMMVLTITRKPTR